ncbi:MAG: sulfite exporter TauE/SafE family protein, partial [Alphaproteobacteria bacterium]|nr:sulfite exporter TauE/SafE family protein [Alphaproteobacteria bacterium]
TGSLGAVVLTIILNLIVSLVLLRRLWRQAPRGELSRLALGSLVGFPIGLYAFLHASLDAVRLAVGLIILGFALWLLLLQRRLRRPGHGFRGGRGVDLAVGLVSGTLATSLAMPGPPVMLYLSAAGMEKMALRACTLCLFTLSYAAALAMQAGAVAIADEVWLAALVTGPLAVLGALLGDRMAPLLDERLFRGIVLAILIATGAYTTYAAVTA